MGVIEEAIQSHNLPPRVRVACSGGVDSVVLLHATKAACAEVQVLHVDHGMRKSSADDAKFVQMLAKELGCEYKGYALNLGEMASETVARRGRYECFDSEEGPPILLGHHQDDQAETLLLRLVRGTGIDGAACMAAERTGYLRPLLNVSRKAILRYAVENNLRWVEDPTNQSNQHMRNQIRNEVFPILEKFNPQVRQAFARFCQEANEVRQASQLRELPISVTELLSLNSTEVRQLFRPYCDMTFQNVQDLRELCGVVHGTQFISAPGGRVVRSYETVDFQKSEESSKEFVGATIDGISLRIARAGDRMRPVRLKGASKKLSDLFGQERIPRHIRWNLRVLERLADGEILWAEKLGVSVAWPPRGDDGSPLSLEDFGISP